jgi:hypothetical protein
MPAAFKVTGHTTLDEFSAWLESKPAIDTIRLRKHQDRGYIALAEIVEGQAILGEPSESLVETLDSMVSNVEELFLD